MKTIEIKKIEENNIIKYDIEGLPSIIFYQKKGDKKYSFRVDADFSDQLVLSFKTKRMPYKNIKYAIGPIIERVKEFLSGNYPEDNYYGWFSSVRRYIDIPSFVKWYQKRYQCNPVFDLSDTGACVIEGVLIVFDDYEIPCFGSSYKEAKQSGINIFKEMFLD